MPTNLLIGVSSLGAGMVLLQFLGLDRYLGSTVIASERTKPVAIGLLGVAGALVGIAVMTNTWSPILVGLAVTVALLSSTLQCGLIREHDVTRQIVVHTSLASPGTAFRRENVNARWEERRDRLVFFIREQDWKEIAASTPETRRWFERFSIAPGLYSAPSDNEILLLVDSLQLYRFLLSPDHTDAVDTFAQLLRIPAPSPAGEPMPPETAAPISPSSPTSLPPESEPELIKESVPSPKPKKRKRLPSPSVATDKSQLEFHPPASNMKSP